jgi:hypothetical protein
MYTISDLEQALSPTLDLSTQQVIDAVRDSIEAGLVIEDLDAFEEKIKTLEQPQLEEYLQDLWDEI